MDRFLHHLLRWLVVVLGLVWSAISIASVPSGCTLPTTVYECEDAGFARSAIEQRRSQLDGTQICVAQRGQGWTGQLTINTPSSNTASSGNFSLTLNCIRTSDGARQVSSLTSHTPTQANFSRSCATRQLKDFTTEGWNVFSICDSGCEFFVDAQACDYLGQAGTYTCAILGRPSGSICSFNQVRGFPVAPRPRAPENPDRDGDGVPNGEDEAPDDPECALDCGPQPPPEDEPEPGPEDDLDDGQQVTENLGPKLDKIEQAVLGLGPKVDAVRTAVDRAASDANADADRMVSAIDAVAAAVRAQGPNVPGQPGEPGGGDGDEWDWTPGTPGPDGGELPSPSSVIENADAAQLMSQLDQDGWSLPRGCPALRWPQSFDLGWGAFDMAMPINIVCTALAILGWVIGLAGLIQASFILSRIGQN